MLVLSPKPIASLAAMQVFHSALVACRRLLPALPIRPFALPRKSPVECEPKIRCWLVVAAVRMVHLMFVVGRFLLPVLSIKPFALPRKSPVESVPKIRCWLVAAAVQMVHKVLFACRLRLPELSVKPFALHRGLSLSSSPKIHRRLVADSLIALETTPFLSLSLGPLAQGKLWWILESSLECCWICVLLLNDR